MTHGGAARPSADELLESARQFRLPLRMRFRDTTVREGLLLEGPCGWAEFAPFDDYDDVGAARWLAAAIEAGWGRWPEPVRDVVPVSLVVPATTPALAAQHVRDGIALTGCTTVKVKVAGTGSDLEADVARIVAVREVLDEVVGRTARIRIDANGAWSTTQARAALAVLDDAAGGLEYVEQPCATLEECVDLRPHVAVPIAVDEGLRRAADPAAVIGQVRAAADLVIVKALPLGGVAAALDLVEALDLPAVVSGSLDTAVGLSAGVALAAALPRLDHAAGLGTGLLLARDVLAEPLAPRDGVLSVGRVVPEATALAGTTTPQSAWVSRLRRAWEHLPG